MRARRRLSRAEADVGGALSDAPAHRVGHTHDVDHRSDVVHPHDVRAAKDRRRGRRRARKEALVDRASGDRAEMALPRRSGEDRRNLTDFTEAAQERERFSGGLGEAEARIDDDTLSLDACRFRAIDRRAQVVPNEANDGLRIGLPIRFRPRTSPAVREHQPRLRPSDGLRHTIFRETGDVVSDRRARLEARIDDRRAARIDRYRHAHGLPQPANRRDRAPQLLLGRDLRMAGPR